MGILQAGRYMHTIIVGESWGPIITAVNHNPFNILSVWYPNNKCICIRGLCFRSGRKFDWENKGNGEAQFFLSFGWESVMKSTLSLPPSLSWPSLLDLAGSFTAHLFSNGNALTTNLKFSTRRFWFCCREKSYEKNLNQVFHFGPLQLQPKF